MDLTKLSRQAWTSACMTAAGFAVLLGSLGQFGRISVPLDAINNFSQIWMAAGVAGGLGLILVNGTARIWGIVAIVLMWTTAAVNFGSALLPVTDDRLTPELQIVQFNAYKANQTPDKSAQWILDQEPDIVILEEGALAGFKVRDLLRQTLPYTSDCLGSDGHRCSTMILSAEPPIASGGLAEGDPENRQTLSAAWARFDSDKGPFTVVGVHMRRPWPYDDQTADLQRLRAFVRSLNSPLTIVAGDFNQTPWTFGEKALRERMGLRLVTSGFRTWPALPLPVPGHPIIPLLAIDHVYAGPGWAITSIERGLPIGSDHLPVVVSMTTQSRRPKANPPM